MNLLRALLVSSVFAGLALLASGQASRNLCRTYSDTPQLLTASLWNHAQPFSNLYAPQRTSPDSTPHKMDFPYYSLRDEFDSILRLNSESPESITFVLAAHNLEGQGIQLPAMTIAPQQTMVLDLAQLLGAFGGDFREGSISVLYEGKGPMPLAGQVTIQNLGEHLVFESRMTENDPGMNDLSPVLHGLWWGLETGREASVAIFNTANQQVEADVNLEFNGTVHQSRGLTFNPYQTKVLSINDLLTDLHIRPADVPEGGITVIFRRPNPNTPTLIAQGRVTDRRTGFSTTLNFAGKSLRANIFHASGVPIGTPSPNSPYAGMGTFIPRVILRNLLEAPQTFHITLSFPHGSGTDTQQYSLQPITVEAHTTRDISLKQFFSQLPLPLPFASIRIEHSGIAGSAIAEVSSIDELGDLVVDSYLVNESDPMHTNSGINPWHLDDQTESILFLTNTGEEVAYVALSIQAEGTRYFVTTAKLQPYETRAIDLRSLRDAQKKDFNGTVIPRQASDGNLDWRHLRGPSIIGRTLVISRSRGVSSNFSCSDGCCPTPDFRGFEIIDFRGALHPAEQYRFRTRAHYIDCHGVDFPWDDHWDTRRSDNEFVATVDSFGNVTAGLSAGSANITFGLNDYGWTMDSEGICHSYPVYFEASKRVDVIQLSQNNRLWFFGTGISAPPSFTLGSTNATLTANGGGTGTYVWTVTSGTARIQFENGLSTITRIDTNTVGIRATSYSVSQNDVIIQLQLGGNTFVWYLDVDAPHHLTPATNPAIQDFGVSSAATCQLPTPGTDGYLSLIPYNIFSTFNVVITNIDLNEQFNTAARFNRQVNNWSDPTAINGFSPSGRFSDCVAAFNPLFNPQPLVPPSPLGDEACWISPGPSNCVFRVPQVFSIGSQTSGSGVQVQRDDISYYRDHGRHGTILSPVR